MINVSPQGSHYCQVIMKPLEYRDLLSGYKTKIVLRMIDLMVDEKLNNLVCGARPRNEMVCGEHGHRGFSHCQIEYD